FFFQAEDGIRDRNVTGVQTCALPISLTVQRFCPLMKEGNVTLSSKEQRRLLVLNQLGSGGLSSQAAAVLAGLSERQLRRLRRSRSEERRVGKERRSRGSRERWRRRQE